MEASQSPSRSDNELSEEEVNDFEHSDGLDSVGDLDPAISRVNRSGRKPVNGVGEGDAEVEFEEDISSREDSFLYRVATANRTLPSGKQSGTRVATGQHSRINTGNRGNVSAQSSATSYREVWSNIAPSLKILSPNEVAEQEIEELEIEDFGDTDGKNFLTDSEDEEETAVTRETTSIFQVAKIDKNVAREELDDSGEEGETSRQRLEDEWEKDSMYTFDRQLQLMEEDAGSDVSLNSDEENELLQEIKNEVKQQVRGEMHEELSAMRHQIEYHFQSQAEDPSLQHLEPDLRLAILKMRKLDRILKKKLQKEKEVKIQRLRLERQMKEEIDELKKNSTKQKPVKEEDENTKKYLSLELPPSHSKGIKLPEDESSEMGEAASPPLIPVTPVFPTQVLDPDGTQTAPEGPHPPPTPSTKQGNSSQSDVHSSRSNTSSRNTNASGTTASTAGQGRGRSKRGKKNFIKRNIELAGHAADAVAMTPEEAARIKNLLNDLEALPDISEDVAIDSGENPYQISLSLGEGFRPAIEEMKRLEAIDDRLKALMAPKEYESVASTPSVYESSETLTPLAIRHRALMGIDEPGEEALRDNKEQRDLSIRLQMVEEQLARLHQPLSEGETSRPTTDQIDMLLGEYALSVSRNTGTETPGSVASDMSDLLLEGQSTALTGPPQLSNEQLQRLLAEAREAIPMTAIHEEENIENENLYTDEATAIVMETHRSRLSMATDLTERFEEYNSDGSNKPSNQHNSPSQGTGVEGRMDVQGDRRVLQSGAMDQPDVQSVVVNSDKTPGELSRTQSQASEQPAGSSTSAQNLPKFRKSNSGDTFVQNSLSQSLKYGSENDKMTVKKSKILAPPMTPPAKFESMQQPNYIPTRTGSESELIQPSGKFRPRSSGEAPSQVPKLPAIDPSGQMTGQFPGAAPETPKHLRSKRNRNGLSQATNAWAEDRKEQEDSP